MPVRRPPAEESSAAGAVLAFLCTAGASACLLRAELGAQELPPAEASARAGSTQGGRLGR
eukprot:7559047-Alexandrium_andersonii.AAC.1